MKFSIFPMGGGVTALNRFSKLQISRKKWFGIELSLLRKLFTEKAMIYY